MGDLRSYWADKEREEYRASDEYKENKKIEKEWNALLVRVENLPIGQWTLTDLKRLLKFEVFSAERGNSGFDYNRGYSVKEELKWLRKALKE